MNCIKLKFFQASFPYVYFYFCKKTTGNLKYDGDVSIREFMLVA